MKASDLKAELQTSYGANHRKSFFGGYVSTRLQSQDITRLVPKDLGPISNNLSNRKAMNGASTASSTYPGAPVKRDSRPPAPKVIPREQKMAQRKRAAERNAKMFGESDQNDTFVPISSTSDRKPAKGGVTTLATGAASVAKMNATKQPQRPEAKTVPKRPGGATPGQHPSSASLRTQAMTPQQKASLRPALNLQSRPNQKPQVKGREAMLGGSRAPVRARAAAALGSRGGQQKVQATPKPKATKICRNCKEDVPLANYFVDNRLPEGLMHMCGKCATKKDLQGKLATPELIVKIMRARGHKDWVYSKPSAKSHEALQSGRGPELAQAPSRMNGANTAQIQAQKKRVSTQPSAKNSIKKSPYKPHPMYSRNLPGYRRVEEDLDDYEDDFIDNSEDEEDWRKELREVTGQFSRKKWAYEDYDDDDRMMEASAAEIRREEARSKRLGREEDLQAEKEEARRQAAKRAAKKEMARKKRKKRRRESFIDDDVSVSEGDDSEEEYE